MFLQRGTHSHLLHSNGQLDFGNILLQVSRQRAYINRLPYSSCHGAFVYRKLREQDGAWLTGRLLVIICKGGDGRGGTEAVMVLRSASRFAPLPATLRNIHKTCLTSFFPSQVNIKMAKKKGQHQRGIFTA